MLQNPALYLDNLWDFDIFRSCFENPRFSFSDLDAIIEIQGRVLILEFKSPTASIPAGQKRMLDHLAQCEGFTVLVVWGKANAPEFLQLVPAENIYDCDIHQLRELIYFWSRGFEMSEILPTICH